MALNANSAPDLILVKTALDKLYDQKTIELTATARATALDPVVFTQDSASNAAVVSSVLGGGGYFSKTTDDTATRKEATPTAAAARVTRIAEFNKDLPIPRTFMQDQQQSAVSKSLAQQAQTWVASRDRNAVGVYANGFTTQLTIDGVALFSNSHTNQNGDTVDNLETGAPSDITVYATINSLRTQVAQTGVILGYEPKFILTPATGHGTMQQITKSVLRSNGAGTGSSNDLNYFSELYPGMKVVYSPFLDATSTTAFFVGSATHGVVRFEREAMFTTLVPWEVNRNNQYIYKLIAREEVDSIEYSGLVGCSGS